MSVEAEFTLHVTYAEMFQIVTVHCHARTVNICFGLTVLF